MSRYVFKLPDLGEGTVAAEIVNWHVKPGDLVAEDEVVVEVMTEKAAVEVPAPVSGRVISTTGAPGDTVAVGAELIVLETEAAAPAVAAARPAAAAAEAPTASAVAAVMARPGGNGAAVAPASAALQAVARSARVATSPAVRRRAHEAGIDLRQIPGSGPKGRIVPKDLEAYVARRAQPTPLPAAPRAVPAARPAAARPAPGAATEEIKVIGVRRLIAQRMSEAKRNIPHFAYVEELDITELESLRRHLNGKLPAGAPALTYLPFLALALVRVLRDFPQCNAHYDAERGVIVRYAAVHLGVATQTPDGLKVPVVHDAQARSLWELAAEMRRVSEAARTNKAKREELTGSTITITSLGKLGGIASTPIINAPEVAIIGVNRAVERPVVFEGAIAIRRTMNLSSSFDHRFVDGYDAAAM
ncbi:MAG TPA: dihydrolipoamide acetyltransferase family protein, partial [Steroidobacteraceae bacterium]|nr:dihydrolipoamide acetyltransferase family protein [Steroidobacteraceae bacterium]